MVIFKIPLILSSAMCSYKMLRKCLLTLKCFIYNKFNNNEKQSQETLSKKVKPKPPQTIFLAKV